MKSGESVPTFHSCLSPIAVDNMRAKQEMDELSRELEAVKNAHIQLRFSTKGEAASQRHSILVPKSSAEPNVEIKKGPLTSAIQSSVPHKHQHQQPQQRRAVPVAQVVDESKGEIVCSVINARPSVVADKKDKENALPLAQEVAKKSRAVPLAAEHVNVNLATVSQTSSDPKREPKKPPLHPSQDQSLPRAQTQSQSRKESKRPSPVASRTRERGEERPKKSAAADSYLRRLMKEHAPQKVHKESSAGKIPEPETDAEKQGKSVLLLVGDVRNEAKLSDRFAAMSRKDLIVARHEELVSSQLDRSETASRPRTAQDILEQRKRMMRPRHFANAGSITNKSSMSVLDTGEFKKGLGKEAPRGLLERLANGEKRKVGKKEMLKLTRKNYQQLPEVVLRRREAEKKAELMSRIKHAKEYEKVSADRSQRQFRDSGTT